MEVATRNGLIAVGVTVLVVGGGFLLYRKYSSGDSFDWSFQGQSSGADKASEENFSELLKNLAVKATNENSVVVPFNTQKDIARFYNNNRVVIFNGVTKAEIMKGTYSEGGKSIQIDGGKNSYNISVYKNLLEIIKK